LKQVAIAFALLLAPEAVRAEDALLSGQSAASLALGSALVIAMMGAMVGAIMLSSRLAGSSLFNRLFIVVAAASMFFSAVSSAIGFALITAQETSDFFRNAILPPAFGVFVFFLGCAVWIGGAELVRNRDWFRKIGDGPIATLLHFLERALKIFIIIPVLASILFVVSTWTTVVGIAGVDAVRHTYNYELERLQSECAAIVGFRQKDKAVLADLALSVRTTKAAAMRERENGFQSGSTGAGPVSSYIEGVALWYEAVEDSARAIVESADPAGVSPFAPDVCAEAIDPMRAQLAADAYANYDAWAGKFASDYNAFTTVLNRWRQDRRVAMLLESQLDAFERANPRPQGGMTPAQSRAINQYAEDVKAALGKFARAQKLAKPAPPIASAAELSPARGLDIISEVFAPAQKTEAAPAKKPSRTAEIVAAERIPALSEITPRDAVLKNAKIFSDVWALGIAWDFASYILMLAFLFFPSAERAARAKD
jgi:hypothetical protein